MEFDVSLDSPRRPRPSADEERRLERIGFPPGSVRLVAAIPADATPVLRVLESRCRFPGDAPRACSDEERAPGPGTASPRVSATFWIGENRFAELVIPSRTGTGGAEERPERISMRGRLEWASSLPLAAPGRDEAPDDQVLNPGWLAAFRLDRAEMVSVVEPVLPAAAPLAASSSSLDVWLEVSGDRIHEVTGQWLVDRGASLLGAVPAQLKLTLAGVEQAIQVVDLAPVGILDVSDRIRFVGRAKTGENDDGQAGRPEAFQKGDFTDVNAFRLTTESGSRLRVGSSSAAPGAGTPAASFRETLHFENENQFFVLPDPPPEDHFLWAPVVGNPGSQPAASYAITIPNPHPSGSAAALTARLMAYSFGSHTSRMVLNGGAPSPDVNHSWSTTNYGRTTGTWSFPASQLAASGTCPGSGSAPSTAAPCLGLSVPIPGTPSDYQILDWAELSYDRTFASDGSRLAFSYAIPSGSQVFRVTGFTSDPSTVGGTVWETTDPAAPVALAGWAVESTGGGSPWAIRFEVPHSPSSPVTRRFEVRAGSAAPPDALRSGSWATLLHCPGDSCTAGSGADYVVVYHPAVVDPAPGSAWNQFLAMRSAGQAVRTVDIQQVFDEFSNGVFDPRAIRSFLQYAWLHWNPAPTRVLLVGDATVDYKDHLGQKSKPPAALGWVPTMAVDDHFDREYVGYFISDSDFGDVVPGGNVHDYPELEIGRIPARTPAQSEAMLAKIVAYETSPPSGSWKGRTLFLADRKNSTPEDDPFESIGDSLGAQYFASAPFSHRKIYFGRAPYNSALANIPLWTSDTRADFDSTGALYQFYVGHGNTVSWGGDSDGFGRRLFMMSDVDLLGPSTRLPFSWNFNCYTGHFARLQLGVDANNDALAEHFFKASGRGFVGAYAPTGLGWTTTFEPQAAAAVASLFGVSPIRHIGTVAERVRRTVNLAVETEWRAKILLGDPALRLALPDPAPPTGLVGTPAPRAADLSWNAASGGGYHVWRSVDGGSSWSRLTSSPIASPSYHDAGLTNLQSYRYRVSRLDSEGYESGGSSVVTVVPENPDPPPAPTALVASDTGSGGTIVLSWVPPVADDLAAFRVSRCAVPCGTPVEFEIAAPASGWTVSGLVPGQPYEFRVFAKNDSNQVSAPAGPVIATPTQTDGDPLPSMVGSLRVTRSGASDLRLDWSSPTVDFRGNPTTPATFRIYRTTRMPFTLESVPSPPPQEKLVVLSDPGATSWVDMGAFTDPWEFHYVVLAVTASGLPSSASRPAPAPVGNLDLRPDSGGVDTNFSWSPVSTGTDGLAASVVSYAIYQSTDPAFLADRIGHANRRAVVASSASCHGTARYCDPLSSPAGEMLFFRVVAVDDLGNEGP